MLRTEMRNPKTMHIDQMTTLEMVSVIAEENYVAVRAVEAEKENIALAVDAIAASFANGGRLFFIGAGPSGRLGVLDASECPPTFGVDHSMVTGIIAGGKECMFAAGEGAEDRADLGAADVVAHGLAKGDVLVGVSVAGGAAYVVGAMQKAHELGAVTVALTCNPDTLIEKESDICICTDTGPEVITGSTRMKAGTAHKMVMNILTTCAMVKNGKVYENMMVNLRPANIKLKDRMVRITADICHCTKEEAYAKLEANEWNIRKAAGVKE